jgi:hypothetical protein
MPCLSEPTSHDLDMERARNQGRDRGKKEMESLVCSACRVLERMGYDFDENPQLSVWWDNHKRQDAIKAERAEEERQREEYQQRIVREALKKPVKELSVDEKNLLKRLDYL